MASAVILTAGERRNGFECSRYYLSRGDDDDVNDNDNDDLVVNCDPISAK